MILAGAVVLAIFGTLVVVGAILKCRKPNQLAKDKLLTTKEDTGKLWLRINRTNVSQYLFSDIEKKIKERIYWVFTSVLQKRKYITSRYVTLASYKY